MALIIKDEDVAGLAPMSECVAAFESALAEYAQGKAPGYPRRIHLVANTADGSGRHSFGVQVGSAPSTGMAAIRLNSGVNHVRGERRGPNNRQYQDRDWGLVLLFSLATSRLEAIIPQFTLSGIRVGATTGVAVKYLAREDAEIVGVFGSSKVARADLEAVCCVRKIREARVFSPNQAHRREFAAEMSARLGIDVQAVDEPRAVIRGAGIVCVSTNSNTPVFDGAWLEPGQTVTSTKSTPRPRQPMSRSQRAVAMPPAATYRREIDPVTITRADAVCLLSEEMVLNEQQREILDLVDAGQLSWDGIYELGDAITGRTRIRKRPEDLVFYNSTGGMGIQMAASGSVIYKNALERGIGFEIPDEYVSADMSPWYRRGYYPSP